MKTFIKIYQIHSVQYSLPFSTCCQIYHTLHMLLNHVNDSLCLLQLVSSEFFIDMILPAGLWPWGGLNLSTEMSTGKMSFTFMGPCIVHIFKHNQQDATIHNSICYYKCSTCFRRFLRPSSGAQYCIHSIGYLSSFFCFLPLLSSEFQLTHNSGKKQKKLD